MIFSWVLATVILSGCVTACVHRWRSITKSGSPSSQMVARLRRTGEITELAEVSRTLPADSGERALVDAVAEASSRSHGVALMNEQLAEIHSHLAFGQGIPAAAGRIAVFTGLLFACVELTRSFRTAGGPAWRSAAVLGALGVVASVVVRLLGRRTEEAARRRRAAWNDLVDVLKRRLDARFPEQKNGAASRGPIDGG